MRNQMRQLIGIIKAKIVYPIFVSVIFIQIGYSQDEEKSNPAALKIYKEGERKYLAGNYQAAIDGFSKAILIDNKMLKAYLQRGFSYGLVGNFEKAIADYSKVIEIQEDHLFAYISRGAANNKLNRFEEAIKDFDKALEIDPKNQEAFNTRGFSKKGLGDFKGACEDWRQSKKMGNSEAKIILKNNKCK